MAKLIKVDGSELEFDFDLDYNALRERVGGWFEIIRLESGGKMYVDEEGKLKRRPRNHKASSIAKMDIVGDVVVVTDQVELLLDAPGAEA